MNNMKITITQPIREIHIHLPISHGNSHINIYINRILAHIQFYISYFSVNTHITIKYSWKICFNDCITFYRIDASYLTFPIFGGKGNTKILQ